ncbi:MAG: aldehyde dehydrogenase family protein [Calothrix sp. C42_A2020_038]|nr:aldehyde dehydrogenase family protein [Calothrix sp. C42_A2020_038]
MDKSIEVRNPRTGKSDYVIIPPPHRLLAQQCQRMRRAQARWYALGVEARIETLQSWKQFILKGRDKLTEALIADTGRLSMSLFEIDSFIANIDRWCLKAPRLLRVSEYDTSISYIKLQQTAEPYPLVGVISPWSLPLLLSTVDTIPALLAGCAVIVKPSEITPRFMAPLQATLNNVPLLRDVLSFVEGGQETGAFLLECVDLVCFTGNLETGRSIFETAAEQFIPAFLELGGKDPAIVLESADLDLATSAILWGAVVNSGQSCHSIERIYVAEAIFEKFYHQLVAKAHRLQLAHPTIESGELGPIIAAKQAMVISEHLQDAKEAGAVVHCGGIENINGGWWCRPTVLTEVDHSMKVMTEETFGPIMPVMAFKSIAEAIELANDSIYGNGAAVFGSEEEAIEVSQHIHVSTISINDASLAIAIPEGETNAFKFSGIGEKRFGAVGLNRFLCKKTLFTKTKPIQNPWWFDS